MFSLKQRININKNKTPLLILLILVVSAFPRLWSLNKYPPLVVDEPANIRDIDLVFRNGLSLTAFHWDFSKSQIVHLPAVLLIKLGVTDKFLALRYASVIISLASLIPFYLIAKCISDELAAFCSTLLFSFSYYFMQFSRVGWTDVTTGVFLGLMLFLMIIKIKAHNPNNMIISILAGVIAGFIFYGYRSGIIILLVGSFTLLTKSIASVKNISELLIFILFFLLTAFPWINTIYKNKENYDLRLRVVSIQNTALPYHSMTDPNSILIYQIKQVLSSWIFLNPAELSGTESPRYLPQGFQIANWLVKIGFWVGLVLALLNIKKTYPLLLIFILGLYGQVVTVDPPNGARGLIILPCIYLIFSLSFKKILTLSKNNKFIPAVIIFFSIVYSISDFMFYQYWMSWIKV